MTETDARGATPARAARVHWGLPDALLAWIGGTVLLLFATAPMIDPDRSGDQPVDALLVGVFAQGVGVLACLWLIARRKGVGSLRDDFGFAITLRTLGFVLGGVVVYVVAAVLLLPISALADLEESSQDIVRVFEDAKGIEIPFFVLGAVVVAPIAEELLFRGALLRGLLRRTSPLVAVLGSAVAFALVHVLGDTGTGYYVPAFVLLGIVSGWCAVVTGNLAASIGLHMGFNLLSVVLILS